jgi:hypothetical protein
MITVTMGRTLSMLSAVVAVAFTSTGAAAQVIVRTDGAGVVGTSFNSVVRRASIPDDSVRSYLTRFEPGVLDDESGDATIVTMVLDNDGTYLRSTSHRAKMIEAVPGRVITINGDSVRTVVGGAGRTIVINGDGARAIAIPANGDSPAIATVGPAIAINALRAADGAGSPGMLAGVTLDEIGGLATKHYAAGEMGKGPILVTFIYLK